MKVKGLYLKNFRCFDELKIQFSSDYTVLIGNNGAGKSSILNAFRILLDDFVTPIQSNMTDTVFNINFSIPDIRIITSDVKLKSRLNGNIFYNEPQYPVLLKMIAKVSDGDVEWSTSIGSRTSGNPEKNPILKRVHELQVGLVNNEIVNLPVIVSYNAKRLWNKKISASNENDESERDTPFLPRLKGYVDCLGDDNILKSINLREWFMRMFLIERKKMFLSFKL